MAISETIAALRGDGSGQVSGPKKQNQNFIGKGLTKLAINQAAKAAANIAQNAGKKANNGMPANAMEQTRGGYNYNLMDQGQFAQGLTNPLNGSGHVAGIPQGPSMNLVQPLETPAADTPANPVTNVPKKTTPVTQPAQQQQQIPEEQKTSEDYGILPAQQEEEPEVVEEIPEQPFGGQLSEGGYIYGREIGTDSNGADFQFGEYTNADPNSPEAKTFLSRKNNYNSLQAMNSYDAAALIVSGTTPFGDQAMYDLQQWNPAKYQQIQDYVKELRAEDNIYAISHGQTTAGSSFVESTEKSIENSTKSWVDQNSTARTKDQVSTMLSTKMDDNITAGSAKQQMMQYKSDIVDLQYKLEDLPNQAKKAFKGDMPEYLYKARMSNRQQEIQTQIDKLESKYNAMADIYKTEMSQMQRQAEMELKYRQLELQQNNANFDMWYKSAQLEQNQVQRAKDAQGNMKAYKIVNGQVIQVDDGTAYQGYTTTVSGLISQANQMASAKATGGQCEAFTDNFAQKAAGVRMVGNAPGGETTAAEKAWYATQFGTFSDYIPEIGDVAVFTNNGSNGVSKERGHTMYVTGYDPATGVISMVGSNNGGDERVYSMQYSLGDFYNKGGQGFWNPYKYAQWTAQIQSSTGASGNYNQMEDKIDAKIESGTLNATQMSNLSKFGFAYEGLAKAKSNGALEALINGNAAGMFIQNVAMDLNNLQKDSAGKIYLTDLVQQLSAAAAQHFNNDEQYEGFLAVIGVIEAKLRKESGAAISEKEWKQDFLQYLPMAADTNRLRNYKVERLDDFLKRRAKEGGLTKKDYISIFDLNDGKRSID